jgi:hypothetical protein
MLASDIRAVNVDLFHSLSSFSLERTIDPARKECVQAA